MQVEIVNTLAQGHADGFQAMIDWCEATQSKAILGGTLTSQTGANGNRSLGDMHNEVRLDIRNDDAAQLDRSLSDYLIYPIAVLNGLTSADRAPRFTSDTQEPDDLALYADALPKLVSIGAQIPMSYLHDKLKIPEPEGDEPVLGAPGEGVRGGGGRCEWRGARGEGRGARGEEPVVGARLQPATARPPAAALAAAPAPPDPDPTPVTALTEHLEQAALPHLAALIARVEQAVTQADSLEALREDLLALYGDLDTKTLTALMQMAFATADLAGRVAVRGEG